MDGLHSLLDCSPPWMSCFSRRPPPRVTSYPEELLSRFNVASFCLELLQDVHNTKHRDSVLLVSMYRLSMLVTLASNSAQRRVIPTKTSLYEANFKLL